jgi:hypothetical protein
MSSIFATVFFMVDHQPFFSFVFGESARMATGVLDSRVQVAIYLNYFLNKLAILCLAM